MEVIIMELITYLHDVNDIKAYENSDITSVIVGVDNFSLRVLKTYPLAQLVEIISQLKAANLKTYILMNAIFFEEQLPSVEAALKIIKELNVDGIYFSDLGLAYEASKFDLVDKLIYNPDTLITNHQDVLFYLAQNFKSVVLSKEITLENMLSIAQKVQAPLDVVAHGRLQMMHSRRSLLSNYDNFLNNELQIQQSKPYYLVEQTRPDKMPIIEDQFGTHIFTGFTLATFKEVKDLVDNQIERLIIDNLFFDLATTIKIASDYTKVINGEVSGEVMFETYQNEYPQLNYTNGFMEKETGLVK